MNKLQNDTIAAIATALSNSAISIIKVSGDEAIEIVNSIFKGKDLSKVKSHTIHYGYIIDNEQVIDEVLVSVFKAPKTFTTEDVVEINCHGGIFVTNKILEIILVKGARLAEPGEFTKRAFLGGRIDLTQAEAVIDVIESNTNNSLKMASLGLLGETKKIIKKFRDEVLECLLKVEVNIDYPEYEDEEQITVDVLLPTLKQLDLEIDEVLEKSEVSKILKYGIKTAIIGKPNVGKSSLLNALIREDKAIVSNIAGTTRDIVEGDINIGGIVLHLIDTAGVHETIDFVEKIGVEKSKNIIKNADLIILVFDNNSLINDDDEELLRLTANKKRIIVVNKKDLERKIDITKFDKPIFVSSFDLDDIHMIEQKIKDICNVSDLTNIDSTYIGNARQVAKLKIARKQLNEAIDSLNNGMPIDIASVDINNCWITLGEILGEVTSEELIDELFSRFCLGK
ncbi:MAG: tRNA uridine-5-carboxymethylaminomethyl(34) synthesis GTPase MnmE [Bacilli bacterium]|nr:tRNA uridine-5-carboxymethylaminomethyl(34) synthesis GTPase MnmE [Acholeplasmataceae bacterium]MDY2903277.1 tRNA uridine-5-carboxymethylaminomethyl(34) synthesis GTPase MnmE [Bacilli bacterium]